MLIRTRSSSAGLCLEVAREGVVELSVRLRSSEGVAGLQDPLPRRPTHRVAGRGEQASAPVHMVPSTGPPECPDDMAAGFLGASRLKESKAEALGPLIPSPRKPRIVTEATFCRSHGSALSSVGGNNTAVKTRSPASLEAIVGPGCHWCHDRKKHSWR